MTPGKGEINSNPQVYTTKGGIEKIKSNPHVYTTQEGIREIKNNHNNNNNNNIKIYSAQIP